jgi:hypothetical protein
MRRNNILLTSVALAAVTALLGACSESSAEDDKADKAPSSSPTTPETSAPTDEVDLPDGVLALPEPDLGADHATLDAGRYRVPLSDTLAFDVDVSGPTYAHDDGLFLATGPIVIKTEIAGEGYGIPHDPCTSQSIDPAGPTVDNLVRALTDLPAYEVSRPEPVELGGALGTYLEARIPVSFDASECDGKALQLPGNPATAVSGPPPYVGRWWILDVDGQRVVIQQNCWDCTFDQLVHAPSKPQSITFTSAD